MGQNTLKVVQMLQEAIRALDRVEYQCAERTSRLLGALRPLGEYLFSLKSPCAQEEEN